MHADELDHIRADIRAAMVEAQWEDRTLLPDLLDRLLSAVADLATEPGAVLGLLTHQVAADWAAELLRDCQLRAVSKIPFPDRAGDPPHWSEHL